MAYKKNSMDAIKPPSQIKIDELQGAYRGKKVYTENGYDDFTNVLRADFDRAREVKIPERSSEEDDPDDFIPKPRDPGQPVKKVGVKFGRGYVAKWKIAKIAALSIALLVILVFFFPPFMMSESDASFSESVNIFAEKGRSELKEDILELTNLYNEEALSSDHAEDYRVCTLVFEIKNYTPFELTIPGYSIVTADPLYKDCFVCAAADGIVEDTIAPFSVEMVAVKVLVNVKDMDDKAFDEAVTSLVVKTTGMKKKLGDKVLFPCLPAYSMVSNAIDFRLED